VALVGPGTSLPREKLRAILDDHREAVVSLRETLDAPPYPPLDPSRLALARAFADDILPALDPPPDDADPDELRRRVNLGYEAMLILIDYLKLFTDGPRVPRSRKAGSAPADAPT